MLKIVVCLALVSVLVLPSMQQSPNAACREKTDGGPCKALFRRYHYNPDTDECDVFIYGGCRGNANNFRDKTECENTCRQVRGKKEG